MRVIKTPILLTFFILVICNCNGQSNSLADSFFYSGNNRLRSKWDFIDSSTFSKSIKDYSEAIKINPELWQAYRNRARIFIHQKKFENALEDLTTALLYANKISLPGLFEMRGSVLYELGMNKEAIDDFNIALKDPQDKAKTYLYMARAKWKLGFQKDACKDYNKAIQLNKTLKSKDEIVRCEK